MDASIKIGRIWGIPIGVNTSWFLIFGLLTWSLASGYFPAEYPQLPLTAHWLLSLVTSLLFFGSVLAHELGHAYLAQRNGIQVRAINLFIFGGVAQIGQEPHSPGAEFRIAIAGPFVSLGLAALFGLLFLFDRSIPFLAATSQYLLRINLILALFNLIPGFPLDGGRVLRALIWRLTGNFRRASHIAAFSGQIVAFSFIGYGAFTVFNGQIFNGLWLIFIGWFLQNAATSVSAQTNVFESLRGIKVDQVMSRECVQVPALASLNQVVEEQFLRGGQRCFYIADQGKLQGMLMLRDIAAIPQQKWRFLTTQQVMAPLQRLLRVDPEMELLAALQAMEEANLTQVPVVQGEHLRGILSRQQVLDYLRMRAELGI